MIRAFASEDLEGKAQLDIFVDPGLGRCGFGVYTTKEGKKAACFYSRNESDYGKDLIQKGEFADAAIRVHLGVSSAAGIEFYEEAIKHLSSETDEKTLYFRLSDTITDLTEQLKTAKEEISKLQKLQTIE
jgi:hypothetical protein